MNFGLQHISRVRELGYNMAVRRLLLFAVLGAIAVLPTSLHAQRGFAARAPVRVAPRMAASPARMMPARRGVVGGPRFGGFGGFGHPFINTPFRHRHHFFFNSGCFGNPFCSGFFNPFFLNPYPLAYYPPLFGPDIQYVQQPYAQQQPYQPTYDDSALRDRIDRLTDEVERMREEQQARHVPQPSARSEQVPTVLVFRDGRRVEIQNYGIVGQTLWVFTEHHARKYPLSDLDLQTTRAANEQRGVEFLLPAR